MKVFTPAPSRGPKTGFTPAAANADIISLKNDEVTREEGT
jgi:hypothetical protein